MGHAHSTAVAKEMVCAPELLGYVSTSRARDRVVRYHQPQGKSWLCYLEKKFGAVQGNQETKKGGN